MSPVGTSLSIPSNAIANIAIEGLVPHEKSMTDQELEEELRLFYVGLTRAKNNLFISVIKSRYESEAKVSRFLKPFLK